MASLTELKHSVQPFDYQLDAQGTVAAAMREAPAEYLAEISNTNGQEYEQALIVASSEFTELQKPLEKERYGMAFYIGGILVVEAIKSSNLASEVYREVLGFDLQRAVLRRLPNMLITPYLQRMSPAEKSYLLNSKAKSSQKIHPELDDIQQLATHYIDDYLNHSGDLPVQALRETYWEGFYYTAHSTAMAYDTIFNNLIKWEDNTTPKWRD